MIGLAINGSSTNTFPSKTSGYAIDSILCDKGARDYKNWGLRISNDFTRSVMNFNLIIIVNMKNIRFYES